MEQLIKEINDAGYTVSLHQYDKKDPAQRWDAQAIHTNPSTGASYMRHICFAETAAAALGDVVRKVKSEKPACPDPADFGDLA